MPVVEVTDIFKSFGPVKAVEGVSFTVERGEIFGLLGPNGAGKTTIIRLLLDIFKPDRGRISVLGGTLDEARKARLGYMPEERGLYQDLPLERCLVYLASLKGLAPEQARRRVGAYLERFDMGEYRHKKVKELSKGQQQKAQLVATLAHDPELVIVDEPFSGLDPLNTQAVKELLRQLSRDGVTVIMSTHQMQQVEALCDRLLLIDKGQTVLYGELKDIRLRYSGHAVLVRATGELPPVPGVDRMEAQDGGVRLSLAPGTQPQEVLRALVAQDAALEHFEIAAPTLDEIFIQAVQGKGVLG
ncbi:MAG TPA: ATP-binding cassette domain-containing protein [Anaerolineales bacterium]|nr:ATP-binding cassette domain-containing protein [Anaerolineales bacterium]